MALLAHWKLSENLYNTDGSKLLNIKGANNKIKFENKRLYCDGSYGLSFDFLDTYNFSGKPFSLVIFAETDIDVSNSNYFFILCQGTLQRAPTGTCIVSVLIHHGHNGISDAGGIPYKKIAPKNVRTCYIVTFDGNLMKIYTNGALQGQTTYSLKGSIWNLGCANNTPYVYDPYYNNKFFKGYFDNFSMYSHVLSQEEINYISSECKIILRSSDVYKIIKDNLLINLNETILTKDVFLKDGINNYIDIMPVLEELDDSFDILTFKENDIDISKSLEVNYIPKSQIVIPKKDIKVGIYKDFNNLNLICTGTKGIVKVAISTDKGITWKSLKDGNWIEVEPTIDNIKSDGINYNELINIPKIKWQEIKTDTIRIAYYLEKTSITDDIAVDKLTISGDMAGSWTDTKHNVNYDYEYITNDTLVVKLLKNGDYKINY